MLTIQTIIKYFSQRLIVFSGQRDRSGDAIADYS
jgi:hypothetical protein